MTDACVCDTLWPGDYVERGTVIVLFSMLRFIFVVIMQPICDIFDKNYFDVHRNIYTVPKILNYYLQS